MKLLSSTQPFLRRSRRSQEGYVLMTLLLMVALMFVFGLAVVTEIKFDMRREREKEMIHRGVQYSRAIKAYYKKYQRYPSRIEELESTSNMRFLRKRYKDPVNKNLDFKLLHYGEAKMGLGAGLAGGVGGNIPGANAIGAAAGQNGSLFQSSSFGGNGGLGNGGFGANANNAPGGAPSASGPGNGQAPDSSSTGAQNGPGPDATQGGTGSSSSSSSSSPFGGSNLPIVGVVSASKEDGIREFNHKKKYSEWQFIYDPSADRGGLINGPNQPPLQGGFGTQQGVNPAGGNGGAFGTPPAGLGNNPNLMGPGGPGTPSAPAQNNSPQQP